MRRFSIALLALLLSGCASPWIRPDGVSHQEFKRDVYECKRENPMTDNDNLNRGLTTLLGGTPHMLFDDCMEARGYTR
jgi:hypothetical protein